MSDTLEDIDTSKLDNVGRVKVDTPTNVTILDMTEDCTRLVFDRLTLNQLIHLRAVCHPWNDIIMNICEHKNSLQLTFTKICKPSPGLLNLHNEPQFQIGKQNLLLISQKLKGASSGRRLKRNHDGSLCEAKPDLSIGIRFVARLFPNITNFFCDFQYNRMLELNYILWKWSTNLDTLAIFAYNDNNARICKDALQDFVQCFGLMSSLRRLHLFGNDNKLVLPNVSTFGQLEEFMFINYFVDFSPYFAQLDANRCKILRVGYHSDVWATSLNLSQNRLLISQKVKGAGLGRQLKRKRDGSLCEVKPDLSIGIRFVATLFPNITNFFCDFEYYRILELNYILRKWSTNLHTLAIFAYNYDKNSRICKDAIQDFVQCFHMMSSLRRFHLFGNDNKFALPKVPTFGQLEEFVFYNHYINFTPYFAQLDANRCKILRVGCHSDAYKDNSLNLSETNPELASKLTQLAIIFLLPNHISLHYSEFRNLIHLEIVDISQGNSMADFLQQIVELQKLEILALNLGHLCSDKMKEYSTDNPNYRHTLPIFHKTVTELHLLDNNISINSSFLKFHEYQLLAKIFPRVRKIGIYTTSVKKLNKTTFDSKYRPRFSEAFGERVEVIFFPSKILAMDDFY